MGNGLLSTDDAAGINFGLSAKSCSVETEFEVYILSRIFITRWLLTAGVNGVGNLGRGEVARALGYLGAGEKFTPGENLLVRDLDSRLLHTNYVMLI